VYHGTGLVLAVLRAPSPLDAKRPVIVLRHDPIPELMDKGMTHPFIVRSKELLQGIGPGMAVRFTLKDTPGALLVVRLEVIQE
jgi:Cu/Ag efflux protein CusF